MTKNLKANESEIAISIDVRNGTGSEYKIDRKHTEMGIHRHSHMGAVLAEVLVGIEQGNPEAFCRIMVATLGSGRRILADVMKSDTISTSVLNRFVEIIEETEILNSNGETTSSSDDDDDDEEDEGDNGFKRKLWV